MINTEIIPVIHMLNEEQVFKNVDTCISCGVRGVFLINHAVSSGDLWDCAFKVRDRNPLWIGVNILGKPARHTLAIDWNVDGIWCDETITKEIAYGCNFYEGMVFGGLAFKYQPQPVDLKVACEEAIQYTDVATTSGAGTGIAAEVEKIHQIREYLGDHPMAIASGVSIDNIDNYKGIADYLLVASSITDKSEFIIKDKLKELIEAV